MRRRICSARTSFHANLLRVRPRASVERLFLLSVLRARVFSKHRPRKISCCSISDVLSAVVPFFLPHPRIFNACRSDHSGRNRAEIKQPSLALSATPKWEMLFPAISFNLLNGIAPPKNLALSGTSIFIPGRVSF